MEQMTLNTEDQNRRAQQDNQDKAIADRRKRIKHKIMVMSGKGGVGKSSVAAYLSVALANRGHRVGLMDVDLHGPSIPRMLGMKGNVQPSSDANKILPVQHLPNLEVMSIEALTQNKDAATIWRGPLKGAAIRQFIADIEWRDLDFMVIDSPPGTGDEPLTVVQSIPEALALIVTTPQEVSLADVRKSINFCRQVKMKILGLVQNMSGLTCPHCGEIIDLFKNHGGQRTAEKENITFLGSLPIEPAVVQNGDAGNLGLLKDDKVPYTQAFAEMVTKVEELLGT